MKKLFTYLTVVMLGVAAVACQKEVGVVEAGKGNVVFTIEAPGVSTKAIGDGENVDIVYYEIYKAEEGHKNSVKGGAPLIKGSTKVAGKRAELTLNLLKDQNYVALFWANVHGYGEQYYDVTDLRKVQVKYVAAEAKNAPANDEDRAAFCQRRDFSTAKNSNPNQRVELKRPFAQINLGTTQESLNLDYLITLEQSKMEIAGAATVFNVAEMKATNDYTHVIYDFNAVPDQTLSIKNADQTVTEYAYAGMNYILVPSNQSTVKLTYDIMTDVGTVNRTVLDVPVQANFRTNLLGNLLTQETRIEIIVDNDFLGDRNVNVE